MPTPSVFEQHMQDVRTEMREMRAAVTQLAMAMTKLSILEERNVVATAAIEKLAKRQDQSDNELNVVKVEQIKFESTVKGIGGTMKVMWAAFGTGVIYLGSKLIGAM
jgi:hypothetical protein